MRALTEIMAKTVKITGRTTAAFNFKANKSGIKNFFTFPLPSRKHKIFTAYTSGNIYNDVRSLFQAFLRHGL